MGAPVFFYISIGKINIIILWLTVWDRKACLFKNSRNRRKKFLYLVQYAQKTLIALLNMEN